MKNNNKRLAVLGLAVLCVILIAGVFMLGQSPKGKDDTINTDGIAAGVNPGGITDNPADTTIPVSTAPEINPGIITPDDGKANTQNGNDIILTLIEDKPEPHELPGTAHVWEQDEEITEDDVQAYEELDPVLKNPDVKPNITPAPVTTENVTPQSGEKNGNGQVYIPGFGWVKDEGGGGQGQQSGSNGDWNKIIGY